MRRGEEENLGASASPRIYSGLIVVHRDFAVGVLRGYLDLFGLFGLTTQVSQVGMGW